MSTYFQICSAERSTEMSGFGTPTVPLRSSLSDFVKLTKSVQPFLKLSQLRTIVLAGRDQMSDIYQRRHCRTFLLSPLSRVSVPSFSRNLYDGESEFGCFSHWHLPPSSTGVAFSMVMIKCGE